jgi:Uncharacterized protein conserved in bacteria (DUF2252)
LVPRLRRGNDGRHEADPRSGTDTPDTMVPEALDVYAKICGGTLALAHARSGDRTAIAAYLGSGDAFDRAIADFAVSYADQNAVDHQALVDAIASGSVEATMGV